MSQDIKDLLASAIAKISKSIDWLVEHRDLVVDALKAILDFLATHQKGGPAPFSARPDFAPA